MTRQEFESTINRMTDEIKALFPEGYTAHDGSLYADGIQEKADEIISYVNSEKAANIKACLNRFSNDCDTYRRIAEKAQKKGWPKRG